MITDDLLIGRRVLHAGATRFMLCIGGALISGCIPGCIARALFVGIFLSKVTPPIEILFSLTRVTVLHTSENVFVSGMRVRLPHPHCGHAQHTFNPKTWNWNTSWLSGVIVA